jgi:lipoyl(octanoyl) transferase
LTTPVRAASAVCQYGWLGRVGYRDAWDLQKRLAIERAGGHIPDTLLLLEHPPVYTTGRRGPGDHLRLPEAELGAPLIATDRGGDITFHGPGQLVAYVIMDLTAAGLGVGAYVRSLEEAIIRTLAGYGISGTRECGLTGVWAGAEKIAAIGVRVSRPGGPGSGWITSHGLALNVDIDLGWFERIVPCGIAGRGVTSMQRLLARPPSLEDVADSLALQFGRLFRRQMAAASLGRSL